MGVLSGYDATGAPVAKMSDAALLALATGGLAVATQALGMAAAGVALAQGAGAGVATGYTVVTLPISAFIVGVTIRNWIDHADDDENEARRAAVHIIMRAAFRDAVNRHFAATPASKLRDDSRGTRLIVLWEDKYAATVLRFSTTYNRWAGLLDEEIFQHQYPLYKGKNSPLYGTDWPGWVMTKYVTITALYTSILAEAERFSRIR